MSEERAELDLIIIGGGIAGLWLLNQLHHQGYRVALFEAAELGAAQTLASQGMIHGGIKYALGGALTGASEAIADMPDRWRACLAGEGPVDLTGLQVLSERYYLFAEGTSLGKLTGFFASRAMRGRIERLKRTAYPESLSRFDGVVYGLNDFVLDTSALLARLRKPVADRIFRLRVAGEQLQRAADGWRFLVPGTNKPIHARHLALCAGAGNGPLLTDLKIDAPQMQIRPLHQVVVRQPDLTALYGHCVTGIRRPEPRLTITSHPDPEHSDSWLWYLGGALATDGVERTEAAQIDHARSELQRCVPWIDWTKGEFESLRIDRAEPAQEGGKRPDQAFMAAADGCLVCWPTKLSLAPDLGDRVLDHIVQHGPVAPTDPPPPLDLPLPTAELGARPW